MNISRLTLHTTVHPFSTFTLQANAGTIGEISFDPATQIVAIGHVNGAAVYTHISNVRSFEIEVIVEKSKETKTKATNSRAKKTPNKSARLAKK